jgi:hypothetical protein
VNTAWGPNADASEHMAMLSAVEGCGTGARAVTIAQPPAYSKCVASQSRPIIDCNGLLQMHCCCRSGLVCWLGPVCCQPTNPKPYTLCFLLQEWAGVLASPDVLHIADACATAEDAALMAAIAGKSSNYITQAVDVCLQGLQHWETGDTPVGAFLLLAPAVRWYLEGFCIRRLILLFNVHPVQFGMTAPLVVITPCWAVAGVVHYCEASQRPCLTAINYLITVPTLRFALYGCLFRLHPCVCRRNAVLPISFQPTCPPLCTPVSLPRFWTRSLTCWPAARGSGTAAASTPHCCGSVWGCGVWYTRS